MRRPHDGAGLLRYCDEHADEEPLYVVDDRVPQDGPGSGDAYPPLPSLFAEDDALASIAARTDLEAAAARELARERRYVLAGPAGAGTRFHVDPDGTDAWNLLLSGRKTWAFYPPAAAPPPRARFAPRLVTRASTVWTTEPHARAWFADPAADAVVLAQNEGDLVYVPAGFWHATLCDAASVAVTQNVAGRHNAKAVATALRRSKPALARELARWIRRSRADSSDDDDELPLQ